MSTSSSPFSLSKLSLKRAAPSIAPANRKCRYRARLRRIRAFRFDNLPLLERTSKPPPGLWYFYSTLIRSRAIWLPPPPQTYTSSPMGTTTANVSPSKVSPPPAAVARISSPNLNSTAPQTPSWPNRALSSMFSTGSLLIRSTVRRGCATQEILYLRSFLSVRSMLLLSYIFPSV